MISKYNLQYLEMISTYVTLYNELLRNHVYDWNDSVKSIETFIIRYHKDKYPLHAQFPVNLFHNSNDISTLTTTHLMWRMQCVIFISNKSQYLKNEERYGKIIHGVLIRII